MAVSDGDEENNHDRPRRKGNRDKHSRSPASGNKNRYKRKINRHHKVFEYQNGEHGGCLRRIETSKFG